jgi:hypothetical protein
LEKPISASFTKEGDLLILANSITHAKKYLNANKLANLCEIETSLHQNLNTIKGVVYSTNLVSLTEKEIIDGLKEQQVIDCKKITKMRDGKIVNTPLHILSFNLYQLPKEINVSFLKVKVEPYIPAPMQCKNCFLLGHTKKHCSNDKKCFVCSMSDHVDLCKKVECINCKEQHRSNNKKCPTFLKRQEIIKHKTIHKISYPEATEAVNKTFKINPKEKEIETLEQAQTFKNKYYSNLQTPSTNKPEENNITTPEINPLPKNNYQINQNQNENLININITSTKINSLNENEMSIDMTDVSQNTVIENENLNFLTNTSQTRSQETFL